MANNHVSGKVLRDVFTYFPTTFAEKDFTVDEYGSLHLNMNEVDVEFIGDGMVRIHDKSGENHVLLDNHSYRVRGREHQALINEIMSLADASNI